MIVYIPVYDKGWKTMEIDTEKARIRKNIVEGGNTIIYYGTAYNGDLLFSNPEAAEMWIHKNYGESQKHLVNADTVKWAATR